jgi:membrane protein
MNISFLRRLRTKLSHFPWRRSAVFVFERFRQDRLAQTAGSLTFTTSIALVPLFTVALAAFTVFPIFGQFQAGIQRWLVESLMPESISRQVLGYLTQFSSKASRLGVAGFAALLFSAIALVLTIDHTLNAIWRVRIHRSWIKRMVLYWTAMTLGPLVVALGLFLMSTVLNLYGDAFPVLSTLWRPTLSVLEFVLLVACISALYKFIPNTQVVTTHALLGGMTASMALEVARKMLTLYLGKMSTFSLVYGAFATLPILLIWIYTLWVIVLVGAVWVSCLPGLLLAKVRSGEGAGWRFQLSCECLQFLDLARFENTRGLDLISMATHLQVDPLELEQVLEKLIELDWIGLLDESTPNMVARYVLIAQPEHTPAEPLMSAFLLSSASANQAVWHRLEGLTLQGLIKQRG